MATISVVDVSFRYRPRDPDIFSGLTHEFAPAALTAIGGESGRGKSTCLFVLGLLLSPQTGTIHFDGADVTHASDWKRARLRATRIGFMFQDAQLDPTRTTLDNVMEPSLYAGEPIAATTHRAHQLLEQFGLGERAHHCPGQISGGQAQRVALCRALVNQPGVILADEPTGNLDRANATHVLTALRQAADAGCTVILATHDPFVWDQCDHRVEL